ncbi:MAG: hypothetical protein JWN03_5879 [Nocardia sp.]|nr:hypothetical protein [Nocardia sp.]
MIAPIGRIDLLGEIAEMFQGRHLPAHRGLVEVEVPGQIAGQATADTGGNALDVITVPSRDAAITQLRNRDLAGAYVPDAQQSEVLVAKAGSDTTAMAAEAVFGQVAAKQGVPMTVTDITTAASGDPTGQGIFFPRSARQRAHPGTRRSPNPSPRPRRRWRRPSASDGSAVGYQLCQCNSNTCLHRFVVAQAPTEGHSVPSQQ